MSTSSTGSPSTVTAAKAASLDLTIHPQQHNVSNLAEHISWKTTKKDSLHVNRDNDVNRTDEAAIDKDDEEQRDRFPDVLQNNSRNFHSAGTAAAAAARRPRAETMPTQPIQFPYHFHGQSHQHPNMFMEPTTVATSTFLPAPLFGNPHQHHSPQHAQMPLEPIMPSSTQQYWIPENLLTSPTSGATSPTTRQLLRADDGNTIASTFASLGLEEHHNYPSMIASYGQPEYPPSSHYAPQTHPNLHTSHSYSSLQSLAEQQQQQQQQQSLLHPSAPEEWQPSHMPYKSNTKGFLKPTDLRSSVANFRFNSYQQQQQQPQQLQVTHHLNSNRPRALSAVDQQMQQQQQPQPPEDMRHPFIANNRSIWYQENHRQPPMPSYHAHYTQQQNSRPFLRSSNSSADILEMMARQRKGNTGTTATNSPSGGSTTHSSVVASNLNEEDSVMTTNAYNGASGSLSSSFEQHSNCSSSNMLFYDSVIHHHQTQPEVAEVPALTINSHNQTPTRSLWLGQLNMDPSLGTHQLSSELHKIFQTFGTIESLRVLADRECAFINFSSVDEAMKAKDTVINKMNSRLFAHSSQPIKIGFGKPTTTTSAATNITATTATATTTTDIGNNNTGNVSAKGSPLINTSAAPFTHEGPTRALWIGNIPNNTTHAALSSVFSKFGPIESVRILAHKNCAFINFYQEEDAIKAKKSLFSKEILGVGTGTIKMGYAKVPSLHSNTNNNNNNKVVLQQQNNSNGYNGNAGGWTDASDSSATGNAASSVTTTMTTSMTDFTTSMIVPPSHKAQQKQLAAAVAETSLKLTEADIVPHQQEQMKRYMLELLQQNNSHGQQQQQQNNLIAAIVTERKLIMQEFGEDSDDPKFEVLRLPQTYCSTIPAAPELGQTRKVDISRLRDIRKRLDTGNITVNELEVIAMECLDELVELCSDYIGNTVIQRLFERCSDRTRSLMLETVAPYLASIGVHKNGTWAAQKIIDTTLRLPNPQHVTSLICQYIKPYVPALLLDQFGNYVVQCCLNLGPDQNQFIFDAIVDSCWEIAQGRFGARAVRATLESPHVTKRQQKYVAASLVQHALLLATNANGALLLIWLLDTSGIQGRYRVLAPRLLPHLAQLCTHKLASLTVLKLINQRQEPEARNLILNTLFFPAPSSTKTPGTMTASSTTSSPRATETTATAVPPLINEVLHDQVHGVSLVTKILSSSYIELRERQRIAERVKLYLSKLKLIHAQGYKRLMEEINMVMLDSVPGPSLGHTLPTQFSISPSIAAALQATTTTTTTHTQHRTDETSQQHQPSASEDTTAAVIMANFYAAAAAAVAVSQNHQQQDNNHQPFSDTLDKEFPTK